MNVAIHFPYTSFGWLSIYSKVTRSRTSWPRGEYCPCTSQQWNNAIEFLRKYSTGLGWYLSSISIKKKRCVWSRYLQKLHKTPIHRKSVWTLGCALAYNAEIFDIHHDFSIAHGPMIHPTSIPIDVLIDCSDFYRAGNCRANGWVVNLWIKEPTNETFPGCQYLGIIRNQTVGIVWYSHHLWSGWVRW